MDDFRKNLQDLVRARFPILYIISWEERRVIDEIEAALTPAEADPASKKKRPVFVWKSTTGMCGSSVSGENTKDKLAALDFIGNHNESAVFVLCDFHVFLGTPGRAEFPVIRKLRDLAEQIVSGNAAKTIVLIAPQLVLPSELQKDVTIVDFALPDETEIRATLRKLIETNGQSGLAVDLSEEHENQLIGAALGLTLREAENAFALAMVKDGRLDAQDIPIIQKEKSQIIKKTGVLETVDSDFSIDDVGGLENLKEWLRKRAKSWHASAKRYNLAAPKGVLITGVPGCGKSMTAKAVSSMWGMPLLRLDVGKIFSGLVGSSEENMRTAIKTAEAIAPSILWIDEIEKGFSGVGSNSDGGTSTRIFGTFLTWMQEKTKPVFVIATANRIESLPPEFLRKGRFDEIFFVDLPTVGEREDILRLHLRKRLTDPEISRDIMADPGRFEDCVKHLAALSEGFVGAEIEQVVVSGLFEAFHEDRALMLRDLERAIEYTVPLSKTQAEQIAALRRWANERAVMAALPEEASPYATVTTDSPGDIASARGGRRIDWRE